MTDFERELIDSVKEMVAVHKGEALEMNVLWTQEANIFSIHLGEKVEKTLELRPGLFLDLDSEGRVIGFESHDAHSLLEQAKSAKGFEVTLPVKP